MKRTTSITLFAILSIMLILLSCTMPIYIVTSETDEDDDKEAEIVVNTAAPVATNTAVDTSVPTYAATPTVSVSLDGPWTIWQGSDEQMLDINFLQDDFDVTANVATGDDSSILYEGVISHDGTTVSGTWESTNGTTGSFVMYLDSTYGRFSGNMGGGVPFCGNRLDTVKPSPCLK